MIIMLIFFFNFPIINVNLNYTFFLVDPIEFCEYLIILGASLWKDLSYIQKLCSENTMGPLKWPVYSPFIDRFFSKSTISGLEGHKGPQKGGPWYRS